MLKQEIGGYLRKRNQKLVRNANGGYLRELGAVGSHHE